MHRYVSAEAQGWSAWRDCFLKQATGIIEQISGGRLSVVCDEAFDIGSRQEAGGKYHRIEIIPKTEPEGNR